MMTKWRNIDLQGVNEKTPFVTFAFSKIAAIG